jgi:Lrp/AsnC family transcriptional regulator, leucine-responsive regulatory protein
VHTDELTSLDAIDRKILNHLQKNARATNVELSELAFRSPPQCYRRFKRLVERGVIKEFIALLDPKKVGFGVMAMVSISRDKEQFQGMQDFEKSLNRFPEILECYAVTGDFDYLLKVVAPDLKEFSTFLREKLLRVPGVTAVRSAVCLEEIKYSVALPIAPASGQSRK